MAVAKVSTGGGPLEALFAVFSESPDDSIWLENTLGADGSTTAASLNRLARKLVKPTPSLPRISSAEKPLQSRNISPAISSPRSVCTEEMSPFSARRASRMRACRCRTPRATA